MKRVIWVMLILLIVVTFAFSVEIAIYKWNSSDNKWEIYQTFKATATGSFVTTSVNGNVNGFIPVELWDPSYGRINFKLKLDTSKISATLVFKPFISSHVFGKWTVDNMYMLFKSNDNMSVSYSMAGELEGYYVARVDEAKKPPQNLKNWNKLGNNLKEEKISVKSGIHEFYLWIGLDKIQDRIFVGPIIFDTYIVPNI